MLPFAGSASVRGTGSRRGLCRDVRVVFALYCIDTRGSDVDDNETHERLTAMGMVFAEKVA